MDFFNIGMAYRSMIDMFTQNSRATGRTTRLVESLHDGDMVVCVNHKQAQFLRDKCAQRGVNVQVQVADPHHPEGRLCGMRANGRAIFDHVFVEEYYRLAIERAGKELDLLEKKLSAPRTEAAPSFYFISDRF